jgi:hypothetical protein
MVTDAGKTKGLAEGVRPEQIEVPPQVRFASIRVEAEGTQAVVQFSDGTEGFLGAITPGVRRAWKWERGTSGRWQPSLVRCG